MSRSPASNDRSPPSTSGWSSASTSEIAALDTRCTDEPVGWPTVGSGGEAECIVAMSGAAVSWIALLKLSVVSSRIDGAF